MSVGVPGAWRSLDVTPRYTERHVAVLLPQALWGIAPPPSADRSPRPSDGRPSDVPAMLADMQRAWRIARMPDQARRAVFSGLVLGEHQHEIAAGLGTYQKAVSISYRAGLLALLDVLNGGVNV